MKKRIILGLAALGTALAVIPMFAAFEAHVINVTAKIENALAVSTDAIDFGTVFPQEHLDQPLTVELSSSFLTEDRVDDVDYIIRQKPKCGWTTDNGTVLAGPTATGHVFPGTYDETTNPNPNVTQFDGYYIECPDQEEPLELDGAVYGVLPSLCEYISKEADTDVLNDETTPSFHKPFEVATDTVAWLDTRGRLVKSENDTVDNWTIDLAVPCFGGFCAQDWEAFVAGINPNANAADYVQPKENEHKIFGCDLWVEVTGVSEAKDAQD